MKVYAVHRSSGSYDDYSSWVHKVFAKKEVALALVEKKNAQIERIWEVAKPIAEKCHDEVENWSKYYQLSELGKFWIQEFEVID